MMSNTNRVLFSLVLLVCLVSAYATSCPGGYYGIQLNDGSIRCRSCILRVTCPKTMGVSTFIACGSVVPVDTVVHCIDCVEGKNFSSHHDEKPCQPCLSCQPNEASEGKCSVAHDTTVCKGVCAKGFYPQNNSLKNCTPCSMCHGKEPLLNKKCIDDNMPKGRQCEKTEVTPTVSTRKNTSPTREMGQSTNKQDPTDKDQSTNKDHKHYKLYKIGFVVAVVILAIVLLMAAHCWKKHCKKRQRKRRVSNSESSPLQSNTVDGSTGSALRVDVPCTEIADEVRELQSHPTTSVRKRSNPGSVERRVSFSDQSTILERDAKDEDETSHGILDSKPTAPIAIAEARKRTRTLSSGSSKSFGGFFKRQNSNPVPEHKDKLGTVKRSKTFSSFSSLISNQKGSAEETQSILAGDSSDSGDGENNNDHDIRSDHDILVERLPTTLAGMKVSELNAEVYRRICSKLNTKNDSKDWRTLAGKMGYNNEVVIGLKQREDPTESLLTLWETQSGNDVIKLISLLSSMGRSDVIELLEKQLW